MYEFKTLNDVSFDDLSTVFNEAFSKYYVPIHFSKEQLERKYQNENGVWDLSVGVFEEGKIIGFIMHFMDCVGSQKVLYNGGTGVVPSKWGHGLAMKMYEFVLPLIKKNRVDKMILEVLSINAPAINIYKKIGFEKKRELNCFKGALTHYDASCDLEIKKLENYNWTLMTSFWDYSPTWQNSILALNNLKAESVAKGAFYNDVLIGYIIYNPQNNRIHQIAVDNKSRRKNIGQRLLNEVAKDCNGDVVIINVDNRMNNITNLLIKNGMQIFIQQDEMELIF